VLSEIRDIKDIVFQETKYSPNEKKQLSKLYEIGNNVFPNGYHQDTFALVSIKESIDDVAVANFSFTPFDQVGSLFLNSDIKQVAKSLEGYIDDSKKRSADFRVNKIICKILHKIITEKLFKSRYDSSSEIDKRVIEVQSVQNWICHIIRSETPKFIEDKDFLDILESVNNEFDEIDEILEKKKENIERHDVLSGFDGENHLKTVINCAIEYISSLPGNKQGFSACKLFSDANKKDSDVQKFLTSTNIGNTTVTTFLGAGNP